jgi:hypothetical protein
MQQIERWKNEKIEKMKMSIRDLIKRHLFCPKADKLADKLTHMYYIREMINFNLC